MADLREAQAIGCRMGIVFMFLILLVMHLLLWMDFEVPNHKTVLASATFLTIIFVNFIKALIVDKVIIPWAASSSRFANYVGDNAKYFG